jgi:hypothetical protein
VYAVLVGLILLSHVAFFFVVRSEFQRLKDVRYVKNLVVFFIYQGMTVGFVQRAAQTPLWALATGVQFSLCGEKRGDKMGYSNLNDQ